MQHGPKKEIEIKCNLAGSFGKKKERNCNFAGFFGTKKIEIYCNLPQKKLKIYCILACSFGTKTKNILQFGKKRNKSKYFAIWHKKNTNHLQLGMLLWYKKKKNKVKTPYLQQLLV